MVCAHCGSALPPHGSLGPAAESDSAVDTGGRPPEALAPDDPLIADLREAFGFSRDEQSTPASARAVDRSSEGFSRVLSGSGFAPGTRLGDFEILGEIGRGGMGVVYRARQCSLGRDVALKILPGYARHSRLAVQRFRAEAQAAARLHHSNIVAVYAQGEHNGHFYYAMELIDGLGLDTVIHSRPDLLSSTRAHARSSSVGLGEAAPPALPRGCSTRETPPPPADDSSTATWTREDLRHVAALVAEVADALDYAHRSGVIHRDIKPHNLLLGRGDRLHLMDFGLARLMDAPHLTVTGEVMGTPSYLSPEQIRGESGQVDHRTDIYSLGVTLYELITRQKPFTGDTREQLIAKICATEPVPPRRINPRVPVDLETICLRAMEKDPRQRHPTAALLAEDLRRFAEGRPILSRRVSRLEKAAKWARRHKAASVAIAAVVAVAAVGSAATWTLQAAREREARALLTEAYEQLAFFDYRTPELVREKLARAAELGAPSPELEVVRALAHLGSSDEAAALAALESALRRDPADQRALYLLSWCHFRRGERLAAREAFAQAEALGTPSRADAWFFRGLAVHFEEPATAIESYRQANFSRAREHLFYPQAVLHLARAWNQTLYATRSLDGFSEADASLRELIKHASYGAYPYYLLSISNRLAAEIYQGSTGTRGDALVEQHYAQALDWARRGQALDLQDDRPITAEAECLESMGRYAEALDARTRAIDTAKSPVRRWEGYHYRWRLHYWTGNYDAALADLATAASFDPRNRTYTHVYPALVRAEMGDLPGARALAEALAADSGRNALTLLWAAASLRLLGQDTAARELLHALEREVDFTQGLAPPQSEEWVRALYEYCRGGSREPLELLSAQSDAPWMLAAEASYHAGVMALAAGDRTQALDEFRRAYRSFDGEQGYSYHARLILVQLQKSLVWPGWIAVSLNVEPSGRPSEVGADPSAPGREEGNQ